MAGSRSELTLVHIILDVWLRLGQRVIGMDCNLIHAAPEVGKEGVQAGNHVERDVDEDRRVLDNKTELLFIDGIVTYCHIGPIHRSPDARFRGNSQSPLP